MSNMALYKALTEAGTSEELAQRAAASVIDPGQFATKTDLQESIAPLATKTDLVPFATKIETKTELQESIAPLATKTDLVSFATKIETKTELQESIAPLATKTDLVPFATKTDLVPFATKTDLVPFATKIELQESIAPLATKADLVSFATKIELQESIAPLATKADLQTSIAQLEVRLTRQIYQAVAMGVGMWVGILILSITLLKFLDVPTLHHLLSASTTFEQAGIQRNNPPAQTSTWPKHGQRTGHERAGRISSEALAGRSARLETLGLGL